MSFRLYYIDDSGSTARRCIVYSWVEVVAEQWVPATRQWMAFRDQLRQRTGIPTNYELHAVDFLTGRGRPSLDEDWNRHKANRTRVGIEILEAIGALPGVSMGAVYRFTDAKRATHRQACAGAYRAMISRLDRRLEARDEHGIAIIDGDGRDTGYHAPHRARDLSVRRVIEDPMFADSYSNQFVRIADLVAYCAYQHLLGSEGKRFVRDWLLRLSAKS